MSVLTVSDLRARCEVDKASHCWLWHGATSRGFPRIHSLDYGLLEKRSMSGPLAAWNIAHEQSPPPGSIVFRCCQRKLCLNPAHLRLARSKAEIGLHQRRMGSRKGTHLEQRRANAEIGRLARGIVSTPAEVVMEIRRADACVTSTALALRLGLAINTVSRIRRGESRAGVTA